MGFGGSPVCAATMEEAGQLLSQFEAESAIGNPYIFSFLHRSQMIFF